MPEAVRLRAAVETPQHTGLGAPLTYTSEHPLSAGTLVHVPLGRRSVPGIVWPGEATADSPAELRPLAAVLESLPPLGAAWCELVGFAAGYYQRGVGEVALAVLPPELRKLDDKQLANRIAKLHKRMGVEPADGAPAPPRPELSAEQARALAALDALGGPAAAP